MSGILIHLYVFSNLLLSNDAANNSFSNNAHLSTGRWALEIFSSFSSTFQMPVVIGLISLLAISLTACFTIYILKLSHPTSIILTSVLLVSYPTVASTFAYMFTADAYFIALFINTSAVFVCKRFKYGWVVSILLLAIGCGIYQSYICYAAGLFLFDCIFSLFDQKDIKKILICGGQYISILVLSLFFYVVIQKALMSYYNVTLVDYQGMNTIDKIDIVARILAIFRAYKEFAVIIFTWPLILPVFKLFYWGIMVLSGIAILYLLITRKIYQNIAYLLLIILGILLIPFALNFITILAYKASLHRLMIYAFVLSYVFMIKCVELMTQQLVLMGKKHWTNFYRISSICCAIVIWNNICISNIGYHALQICYESSFALANRITARVEQLEGYSSEMPVAIIGSVPWSSYGNGYKYRAFIDRVMNFNTLVHKTNFFRHYIGITMPSATPDTYEKLQNCEYVISMPSYPEKGSIAIIDGTIVVKLGDN